MVNIKMTSSVQLLAARSICATVVLYCLAGALLLFMTLGMSKVAIAQNESPTTTVQTAVDNILALLRKPDFDLALDRPALSAEITQAFDSLAMAQSVLSTNWKQVTPPQQAEFQQLLIETIESTYIGRIKEYTDQIVAFRGEEIMENRAVVFTVIVTETTEIPITYKLRKRSDGWFVFDVEVENVSMINSYRDTYRSIVSKSGIEGLLEQMRTKLSELAL